MSQNLFLYNTASRAKELFVMPQGVPEVRFYACGPTVYHHAHIGNLRTYLFEDLLRRTLEYFDFKVRHVINITDVGHLTSDEDSGEDKMEKGAERTGKSVWEVAEYYTEKFKRDLERLNVLPPAVWCKATDHIKEQIELVKKLEEMGYTYRTSDGIYFDSLKFPDYAKFARIDIDGLKNGARIDVGEKKFTTDFALWKFSPKDSKRAMEWDSPWGIGFPGWHIECSAMAMKHLGETLDIHCGGTDHIRVHHTNEIAQSECATGKQFSRFWLHGEFLRESSLNKMSKSNGEFLTLDLLEEKGFDPVAYRLFSLTSHYRNYLNFSWEAMESAQESLNSLRRKAEPLIGLDGKIESADAREWLAKFKKVLADDLNSSAALGVLNSALLDSVLEINEKAALAKDFDKVLGLGILEKAKKQERSTEKVALVESLVEERNLARKNKNFAESDKLRDALLALGVVIKDSKNGTTWEWK
ncbi:MAG: cysteine--tRNA ligase [Fibromonadaceae bacterium]|jgi:cysteinyl-tRNA synthetase|nr:cysteine--tRNA ligase [Fibromonadaceae bacterium]